jgi:hypothetical protein
MSTVFQLNPAQVGIEIAERLNPGFAQAGFVSKEAYYQQAITAFPGWPQKDKMLTDGIKANEATQAQLLVVSTAQEGNFPVPSDAVLMDPAVMGPRAAWNMPYGANGWGLDGTTPAAELQFETILFDDNGKVMRVTGPLA